MRRILATPFRVSGWSRTLLLAGAIWASPSLAAAPQVPRPNVIIVLVDDQGYGDLSVHGNPVLKTPHLDRLHAESVRFTDFHTAPNYRLGFVTPAGRK
ncbi:MAG: sulfatase-like hydrolase/transferase [Verrucomicrobia bacterium]|nr:sulfatase-like hydrolase/transferase [Verrucomicrobiota bacterium]